MERSMSVTVVATDPTRRIRIFPWPESGACAVSGRLARTSAARIANRTSHLARMGHSLLHRVRDCCFGNGPASQASEQVIAYPQCVGHDGQCGIQGGTRREEAAIRYI